MARDGPPSTKKLKTDTSRPSAIAKPTGGRRYTVSIAIPGGIITNAQTMELKTALAGQIARAAAIFNVDEIVVFDEDADAPRQAAGEHSRYGPGEEKNGGFSEGNVFMARLLEYLETPQYLRKRVFPMHRDLRYVGLLAPLDCPHHLRIDDDAPYREGITLTQTEAESVAAGEPLKNKTVVDCGLRRKCVVDRKIPENTRVTVAMRKTSSKAGKEKNLIECDVVSPTTPREKLGYYWGYRVRMADSISAVFTEAPFEGGYDVTLGTSERGKDLAKVAPELTKFKHLLVVFGGVAGLEHAVERDPKLELAGDCVEELFDRWVNVAPDQGSRTIRSEEAVLLTLSQLRTYISSRGIK